MEYGTLSTNLVIGNTRLNSKQDQAVNKLFKKMSNIEAHN